MTHESTQFLVTVDAQPYAAATWACDPAVSSTDPDWPKGVTVLPGALSHDNTWAWSESITPVRGETSVGGISVLLQDVVPSTGPAAGQHVWTWLYSRRPKRIPRAALSASIGPTDTTITVVADPGFSTGPQVVWIDREAINCTSYNAGTKTFTVAAGGRGHLGTRAASHAVEPARSFAPFLWAEFPNPQRRRAILWAVRGTVATPIWRGYLGRAPRLDSKDSTRWELQLDHALAVQSARALGPSRASVRVVGFDPNSFRLGFSRTSGTFRSLSVLREPYTGGVPEELDTCLRILEGRLNTMLATVAAADLSFTGRVETSVTEGRPRATSRSNQSHVLFLTHADLRGGRSPTLPIDPDAPDFNAREIAAGSWASQRVLPYAPTAHVILRNVAQGWVGTTIPVDSVEGLPTTALSATYVNAADVTVVQWALSGTDREGYPFFIGLSTVDASTRRITGFTKRQPLGRVGVVPVRGDILITEPTSLKLATLVSTTHWVRALQHGVLATEYGLDGQADPRDWDWSRVDEVISATEGEASTTAREWVFDGSTSVGEFLKETCALDGCAIVLRGSRLAIAPLGPPLPTEPVALTIDMTKNPIDGAVRAIAQQAPGFGTMNESITNVVKLKRDAAEGPPIAVNNQGSVALYGESKPFEVEVKGAFGAMLADMTPFELARGPFSRILGLWGEPSEMIQIKVPISKVDTVALCDVVRVRSTTLPNGEGRRGVLSVRTGRVFGRRPSIGVGSDAGTILLDVVVFAAERVAGYAPCARIASMNPTVLTLATGYLAAGATDYAGSNLSSYRGLANDGGTGHFARGQIVRLRVRDSATAIEEGGFSVSAVDPTFREVELNEDTAIGAYDWPALVAGGAIVDVLFDNYDVATSAQKDWAFVSSRTTRTLNGDAPKEWAP